MLPEVMELVSDSGLIREIDQNLKFNHSFFNKKIPHFDKSAVIEIMKEAQKRSYCLSE